MSYYSTLDGPHSFKTHCWTEDEVKIIFQKTFGNVGEPSRFEDLGYEFKLEYEASTRELTGFKSPYWKVCFKSI